MADLTSLSSKKNHILKVLGSPQVIRGDRSMSRSTAIIVPYPPEEEVEWGEMAHTLVGDLGAQGIDVSIANLYDIVLGILDDDGLYDEKVEIERTHGKARLIQELKGAADIELDIVPAIEEVIDDEAPQLIFLTGVGACHPFLRTSQLLEKLDDTIDVPVVVFYPGRYQRKENGTVPLEILNIPRGNAGGPFYQGRNVFDM